MMNYLHATILNVNVMKRIFLISLLSIFILLCLIGCSKEDNDIQEPSSSIFYVDLDPDSIFFTLLGNEGSSKCAWAPIPKWDNQIRYFDINGDGETDLGIYLTHITKSLTCDCGWHQRVGIQGLNYTEIAAFNTGNDSSIIRLTLKGFNAGDTIDSTVIVGARNHFAGFTGFYRDVVTISYIDSCDSEDPVVYYSNSTSKYVGFRKEDLYGYIHIEEMREVNGIRIKEFAINLEPFKGIVCGQKK
jgi:hypothetical protein